MAGAWLCWHIYIEKINYYSRVRHCVCRVTHLPPLVPVALWWSCADRAALWTGDSAEVQQPQRARRTERWTCPHGSCCCWVGTPKVPGISDMMPRKDVASGRRETGKCMSGMDEYCCLHEKILDRSGEVINLSFSLRLLCLAVPFDRDHQIWLINLLTKRRHELKQWHKAYFVMAVLPTPC